MRIRDIGARQLRLRLQLNSDKYSEHSQTSEKELFSKMVNGFQPLFSQKAPSEMFDWVLDTPLKLFVS